MVKYYEIHYYNSPGQHHVIWFFVNGKTPWQICCELWSCSVPLRVTTQILILKFCAFEKTGHDWCQDLLISSPLPRLRGCDVNKIQPAMIQQPHFLQKGYGQFSQRWIDYTRLHHRDLQPRHPNGSSIGKSCDMICQSNPEAWSFDALAGSAPWQLQW